MTGEGAADSRERRLDAVIAAYLEEGAAGRAPDRDEVLRRHPELADDLAAFFADHDAMKQLARPLPPTADTSAVPGEAPVLDTVRYFGDYELLEEIARGGMG